MRKIKNVLLMVVLILAVTLTSCEKDNDSLTKTEMMTDGLWILEKTQVYENGSLGETQIHSDSSFNFKTNFTLDVIIEGVDQGTYDWYFNEEETSIYIEGNGIETFLYDIDTLTSTNLVLSVIVTELNVDFIFTFSRD